MAGLPGFSTGPPLVLKEFVLDEAGSGDIVRIAGRKPGLLAWLAGLFGLAGITVLRVTRDQVYVSRTGKTSESHEMSPLVKVSSTHFAYASPFLLIVIAAALAVFGAFSLFGSLGLLWTILSSGGMGDWGAALGLWGASLVPVLVFAGLAFGAMYVSRFFKSVHIRLKAGSSSFGIAFKLRTLDGVVVDLDATRDAESWSLPRERIRSAPRRVAPARLQLPGLPRAQRAT